MPAVKRLSEPVVDRLVSHLQADLPTKLAAITAEIGDGLPLDDVVEFIVGERPPTNYPACWVLAESAQETLEDSFHQLGGGYPLGLWTHTVSIVVAVVHPDDSEQLRRKLYRYALAITQVLNDHETDAEGWQRARVTYHSFTRIFQHTDKTLYRQDAFLDVEVTRAE